MKLCATNLGVAVLALFSLAGCHEKAASDDAAVDAASIDAAADSVAPLEDVVSIDAAEDSPAAVDAELPRLGDIGTVCAVNADCLSGSCVDGVCCSSAACGGCQSCSVAGSLGTCAPLPALTKDPKVACIGDSSCDGAGHCALDNGNVCATNVDCVSGFCTDGVCCESACNQQCYSCNQVGQQGKCATITGGTDESASMTCSGLLRCVVPLGGLAPACKLADGQPCDANSDCAFGQCRTYYFDGDGDGYGSPDLTLKRCDLLGLLRPAGYVAVGGDCCDYDKNAHPGIAANLYYSTADGCGNFDYDCDGLADKQQHATSNCTGVTGNQGAECGMNCYVRTYEGSAVQYTQACR